MKGALYCIIKDRSRNIFRCGGVSIYRNNMYVLDFLPLGTWDGVAKERRYRFP